MSIQETPTLMTGFFAVVQAIALLLFTPLFTGISRQIRAKMHSRQGPGIMQDYRDLIKLFKRQSVAPRDSGAIFLVMPYVLLSSMLLLAMALPVVTSTSLFSGAGDIIIVLYIFALFRFFFSLSGLDTGSPFAGIGASRELTLGVLVEPTLFLGLLVVALIAGSTNIGTISAVMSEGWISPTATFLALIACGFATFIEMGKIPFDVAEAEQELQEGPLTEYSGSGLAMVKWGIGLKQVVVAVLFLSIFFPFGSAGVITAGGLLLALVLMLVKLLVIFVLASLVENSLARGRFLLTHHVTWLGFGVAALGFVFYLTGL